MTKTSWPVLPVVTVASVDPVARGSAVGGALCDVPDALAVQYDVERPADHDDQAAVLNRLVMDGRGIVERAQVELEHGCLSCAIREDVLPTLHRLADVIPPLLLLALPVAAEPLPVVRAVQAEDGRIRAAAVVTAVDGAELVHDLLGDDTLAERDLGLFSADSRSVGEVLAHQVEVSDVLATTAPLDSRSATLLEHLSTPPFRIAQAGVHDLDPGRLASLLRPTLDPRGDLQAVAPPLTPDTHEVWTLDLRCDRPVHAGRLLDRIEDLGSGSLRARGHLRLASRPHTACAWDGAGGQLSIGSLGPWAGGQASTRIVVTGTERDERKRIQHAFRSLELTADEHARGDRWWAAYGDDLDPWLGDLADCA
ncbi:MAG: GTP-binding protein [Angustibacter sp.]